MTDYPPLLFLVLQALLTSLVTSVPLLVFAIGWGLFVSPGDAAMALLAYLAFALVSFLSFALFEGEWAAVLFGPLAGGRFPILGGVGLTAAMGWQYVGTAAGRARLPSVPVRTFAATFLAGAFWGAIWELAGWSLESLGMLRDG